MAIVLAPEPVDGRQVLTAGLSRLHRGPGVGGAGPAALVAAPQAMKPIPIYELSVPDVLGGRGFANVKPIAWQYLLVEQEQVGRLAEIYPLPGGAGHKFGAITDGYASGTAQAIAVAELQPDVVDPNNKFELLALRISPLYVTALWLKNLSGGEDVIVIVPPAPKGFEALKPLSRQDFLNALMYAAKVRSPAKAATNPNDPPSS